MFPPWQPECLHWIQGSNKIDIRMQSTDSSQCWSPRQSLWSLIVEHVPDSELPEVRGVLGHSLVDMYTEVHSEVEMWREIWRGIQQSGNHGNRTGTPLLHRQGSPLVDPPAVKELLRAEIRMLLQSVRERANREGRDGEEVLFNYKPDTVNYALGLPNNRPSNHSYPCTPGNIASSQQGSRPSSHCSVQSSVHDEIDPVIDKLNVADIDQVVVHLQSVLIDECEALKNQVQYLQENIEQEHRLQCEVDKREPTVAELKEQRRAIQMDLERPSLLLTHYSSSSSSSPPPMEDLKNRSRLSAGQRALDNTQQPLTPTSALRLPPPPLSHTKPSPPVGAPLTKTSASVRHICTSSLARTQGQHGSTPTSTEPSITQTPSSHRITSVGHGSVHAARSPRCPSSLHGSDRCIPCPAQEHAGFHHRTLSSSPGIQIEAKRNSPVHPAHLSTHCRSLSLSSECVLSPRTERQNSPLLVQRSRNNNIPSPFPALSPRCHTDCYERCAQSPAGWENSFCRSNSNDQSVLATGRPKTQNGRWNSSCGGNLVSATGEIQTQYGRRNTISEFFLSNVIKKDIFVSESGGPHTQNSYDNVSNNRNHSVPATGGLQTQNGRRKRISGINRNNNSPLGKDITQERSPSSQSLADYTPGVTPRHSVTDGTQKQATCIQPVSIQTGRQSFTSLKGPLGGTMSQPMGGIGAQIKEKLPNTYFQPVPPAIPRVSGRGQPLTRQLVGVLEGERLVGL